MNGGGDKGMTKLALLIDGDNISDTFMPLVMREASLLGVIAIRRLYGQFDSGRMKPWQKLLTEYDLTPVNVAPLIRGKNATDMKLVIEAMDMLHGRQLDGICIASSDSDFTPLAARIRANALSVYGFGAKKAPAGYKAAFDRFYECDTLLAAEKKGVLRRSSTAPSTQASTKPPAARSAPAKRRTTTSAHEAPPISAVLAAIDLAAGPDGWAHSQKVGNVLSARDNAFRVKTYAPNMRTLLGMIPGVETKKDGSATFARRKR